MPQLNGGGGDDLGANDEMIAFKDEGGDHEEKIRESAFTERDLADLKSSLVNESEISQNNTHPAVSVCVCVCARARAVDDVRVSEIKCVCNEQVIRRGQQEDQRIYTEKREHLDDGETSHT